jgi:hypothetical protein
METLIDPLNAGDRAAAHVQLQLLQQQWQELQDSKRALSLYLIEYYSDDEEILDDLVLVDEDREAQLRAQIDSLSRFVAAADDQQV